MGEWNITFIFPESVTVINQTELRHMPPPVDEPTARWVHEIAGGVSGGLVLIVLILVLVKRNLELLIQCFNSVRLTARNSRMNAMADPPVDYPHSCGLPSRFDPPHEAIEMSTSGVEIRRNGELVAVSNPGADLVTDV